MLYFLCSPFITTGDLGQVIWSVFKFRRALPCVSQSFFLAKVLSYVTASTFCRLMEQILVFKHNLHDELLPFLGSALQLEQGCIAGDWKTSVISQKVIRFTESQSFLEVATALDVVS